MPSVVYPDRVVNVNVNVTYPVRALDTVYQNTNNRPLLCIYRIRCLRGITNDSTASVIIEVQVSTPPTTQQAYVGIGSYGTGQEMLNFQAVFVVPPKWYYRVTSSVTATGVVQLENKTEVVL